MKKLCMTVLAVLTCGAVQALPVANPAAASLLCDGVIWEGHCGDMCDPCLTWCDAFSVRLGYWGNFVYDRYMETDGCQHRSVDRVEVTNNALYLVGNFWDRFDIFATFGTLQLDVYGDHGIWSAIGTNPVNQTGEALFRLSSTTELGWSIGLRGTIWECGCTSVGAELQYLQARPDLRFYDEFNNDSAITDRYRQAFGECYGTKYYDWQVGIGIAHRINLLVPYAAVRWSGGGLSLGDAQLVQSEIGTGALNFGIPNGAQLGDLDPVKSWGYAVGVTLTDCEQMSLTVEGGFGSSLELSVIAQIRL